MKRAFALTISLILLLAGCAPSAPAHPIPPPNEEQEHIDGWEGYVAEKLAHFEANPPAPNSSEMTDYLYLVAENDAMTATQNDMHEAAYFLAEAFLDDPWKDDDTMEKVLYYGALLECAYKHKEETRLLSSVGFDAHRCVKYVYRGTETPSDAQIAYEQTIEGMLEIGIIVERAE